MSRLSRFAARALVGLILLVALTFGASALWVGHLAARATADYPPTGRFITVGDARMHYVDAGSGAGDAPPIVLVHGNPGSVRDYERLIPVLATTHRVIAIDRPGHGYSDRRDARVGTPTEQARQLHAALEQLGVHRPILVGHSWGGGLALAYAIAFPDDAAGLVLLGTRAYPDEGSPDPLYALLRRPVIGPLLRRTLVPIVAGGTLETRMTDAYKPDSVQADHLGFARAMWMRPTELAATVWDTDLLQRESGSMVRSYRSIRMPVMILAGSDDRLLPESQQLADDLPNAWIEVLPRTGHYLPRTRVAEVSKAIDVLDARARAGRIP